MNLSTQQLANIIIDCLIVSLSSASICIAGGTFGFIVYHLIKIRNSPHRVALLLTANVYFALFIFSILVLEQYTRALSGHLHSLITLNDQISCQIRAYFVWVSICTICYSNAVQSIYRLCRIVFYTKQSLRSFQLYRLLIIIQWILCFFLMLPAFFLGDFKYSTDLYYCQLEYTDVRSILVNGNLCYAIPVCTTIGSYIYTIRQMRKGNNRFMQPLTQIQQVRARRDLIILFRICIILGLLMTPIIPGFITFSINVSNGYLPWWSYQIEWLVFCIATTSVIIIIIFISPHVRSLWTRNHRITVAPVIISVN